MTNKEHLARLKRGAKPWNQWRSKNENRGIPLKLWDADLRGANLAGVNLAETDLSGADLIKN